jgi:hypothetical protein
MIISAWNHPAGGVARVLPIDAVALAGSADELRVAARKIFDDESEDSNLRGLCLEFLLDRPGILAHQPQDAFGGEALTAVPYREG